MINSTASKPPMNYLTPSSIGQTKLQFFHTIRLQTRGPTTDTAYFERDLAQGKAGRLTQLQAQPQGTAISLLQACKYVT